MHSHDRPRPHVLRGGRSGGRLEYGRGEGDGAQRRVSTACISNSCTALCALMETYADTPLRSGGRAALAIHQCTKPVIGAIQGPAVGVGITMALPMTIRVALRSAKIGFVFGRRGIAMEGASSYFLPRLIGYGRALHVVSTGAVYRADDKLLDGLFTEFADSPEECVKKAIEIAEDMMQNVSTVSTYLQREMMWRGMDSAEAQHLLDSRILAGLRGKP